MDDRFSFDFNKQPGINQSADFKDDGCGPNFPEDFPVGFADAFPVVDVGEVDAGFDDIVEACSSFGQHIFDCLEDADGLFVGVAAGSGGAGNLDARSDTDGAGISNEGFPF